MPETITLTRERARKLLIAHHGLAHVIGRGAAGTRQVLERLGCIQLDPLDVIGTNADLVAMARVDDIERGDVYRHLFPHHAFEHFAKQRCILPATAFPQYRQQGHAAQPHWWRHDQRLERVPARLIEAVLHEIVERGPLSAKEITDHGEVAPLDWSGWEGTSRATTMALEILWTRCDIVVCGRTEKGAKLYDVPERALGAVAKAKAAVDFDRWALRERVRSAGLLTRAGIETWSILSGVRTSPLPDEMVASGDLIDVTIEGTSRHYLTLPAFLSQRGVRFDDRVRILGPLDPLLWDRGLVRTLFGFDYVWEVYKPEHLRLWGWYVVPLLHGDRLIGRMDARIEGTTLKVRKLWLEDGAADVEAIRAALERHAAMSGCKRVSMPRRVSRQARARSTSK